MPALADSPLRFTFVIGRYGADILGGAETLARHVAERLVTRGHDVRVLTTRARSHATWANEWPEGTTVEHGVEVRRYATHPRRRPWDDVLKWLSTVVPSSTSLALAWARAQGPVAPLLLDRLGVEARERDLLVFFQLLSHAAYAGMPAVAAKAALVPLVHEERPIYTTLAGRTLTVPRALLVNTHAEAARVTRVARGPLPAIEHAGTGLDTPTPPSPGFIRPTPHPYLLVMGRLAKTTRMLETWRALIANPALPPLEAGGTQTPWSDVRLVTVGERSPAYEKVRNVVQMGFVADAARWDLLRSAVGLVNPSVHESLSLVLLEAWTVATPVIVHAQCDVTMDHVRASNGGIAVDFADPAHAAATIARRFRTEPDRRSMGVRGAAYVAESCSWDRVLDAYERVARAARAGEPS
jgi:glycosyltransferase involved in cell wall biosynthesis